MTPTPTPVHMVEMTKIIETGTMEFKVAGFTGGSVLSSFLMCKKVSFPEALRWEALDWEGCDSGL